MSQYTLTMKQLVENGVNLFNFTYPIFEEAYRERLQNKIIRHYYFREIGFETVGRFLFELESKMNEIMPYYNQLYESTLLKFDPLINYELTESYTKTNEGTHENTMSSSSVAKGDSKGKNLFSDTPQGRINLDNPSHLTSINQDETESNQVLNDNSTNSQSGDSKEEYTRTARGNIGVQTYSALLNDYRTTFLNVDMQVIEELSELFLRVY